mgnify:CR=1 FL=1
MRVYRSLKYHQKLHIPHEVARLVNFRVPLSLYGRLKETAIHEQKSQALLLNELIQAGFEARDTA